MPYVSSVERIGMKRGLEQGLAKGLEQGLERGLERGRQEGRREALLAVASNLLDLLDDTAISARTGLPVEEVRRRRDVGSRPGGGASS
ncbi:MAG: hypothetical protein AB1634_05075 [Thermodesulfobacteriota bacterium]